MLTVGIEDDNDVTPVVAAGIVLQTESHHACRGIEKLQMLSHQMSVAEAESRVMLAKGDEILLIFEYLRITLQILPIELVDAIRRLEGVVYALLATEQFLARQHEGHTL